jgi:hypothetical protein
LSVNILYLLIVVPNRWCVSHFTTTFLLLLKNNSLEGNSSIEIGVRYYLHIIHALRFSLEYCKGVMNGMGLSISFNFCFIIASVLGPFDVRNDVSSAPFEGIFVLSLTCFPSVSISGNLSCWLDVLVPWFEVLVSYVSLRVYFLLGFSSFKPLTFFC